MEDILFYNNYVAAGDIITITITVVIFLLLYSTYAIKKLNYHVFLSGTISLCIAALTSIWYHHMILEITAQNVFVIYLTRAISYSGLLVTYVSFLVYIRNLVDMRKTYRKIFNVSIYGLWMIIMCQ